MRNKMKLLLITLALTTMVGSMFAAEFDYKQLRSLYDKKDYNALLTQTMAMKDSVKTDSQKVAAINYIVIAKQNLGKYADKKSAIADVDVVAKEFGVATTDVTTPSSHVQNFVRALKMNLLIYYYKDANGALEMAKNWGGSQVLWRKAVAYSMLKRYAESSAAYAETKIPSLYASAALQASLAKLPEKTFEYATIAFANNYITDPVIAIKVVDEVININCEGTSITSAKIKEFLQMVNRKYSRRLVINSPTKWDELIQLVRQTLETY